MTKFFCTLAVSAIAVFALTSCGGGTADPTDPKSIEQTAISQAEAAVPLTESPMLGTLPSLCQQRKAARDSAGVIAKNAQKSLDVTDEASAKKAFAEAEKISAARKEAEKAIATLYDTKVEDAGKAMIGKEVPVEFDATQYSAASAKIIEITDSQVSFEASLTLSCPLAGSIKTMKYVVWRYLDANGAEVQKGATTVNPEADGFDDAQGGTFTVKLTTNLRSVADAAKIRFIESR